ncbi:MAG: DUF3043 domain-containing protein [Micromonosporaceae bacterium]
MLPRFRRKPTELADDTVAEAAASDDSTAPSEGESAEATVAGARSRAYTPGKGKATPKRKEANRRTAEKPPANRREALRRMRQKDRESRAERRAGMMAGDEKYMLPRDRGPERGLIRDIVDSRRNVATYFLAAALVVIVGSSAAMPPAVRFAANVFWVIIAVGVVVDSFLLARIIKRVLRERFPKSTARMGGNYMYGIMRTLSFRRLRIPAPRLRVGQKY